MTDTTGYTPSLADLLAVADSEPLDWDTSALADWPNIKPAVTPNADAAAILPAEPTAADFHHAH